MINDLSESLKALRSQEGLPPELSRAEISFERPVESFKPSQTTIDLFLYELRENHDLRNVNGRALSLACTYLITAWPVGETDLALQEQQLLGEVLQVLAANPVLPQNALRGALIGLVPSPQVHLLPPDATRNAAEFWTSLGNKLRLSLSITVTIAMPLGAAAPPA